MGSVRNTWGSVSLRALAVVAAGTALSFSSMLAAEGPPTIVWARQHGTGNQDFGYGVGIDGAGGVYFAGATEGSLAGPHLGWMDAFLFKYNTDGNVVWSRQFGTSDEERASEVALDGLGNIYVTGYTGGSLGGAHAGGYDAFLVKYDPTGSVLWSRQIGTSAWDFGNAVAVDASGAVYVVGHTQGSLAGAPAGRADAFVAKYDAAGNRSWVKQFGTPEWDAARGIAIGASGEIYIGGTSSGSLGGANAGGYDAFLCKYDAAGSQVWARQFGSAAWDLGEGGVAVDGLGNGYIAGSTEGSLGAPNLGDRDAFLAKYTSAGVLEFIRQVGTAGGDGGHGVAADDLGNAYLTGLKGDETFLAKWDSSGGPVWSLQFGDSSIGHDVAIENGGIYVAGWTWETLGGPNRGYWDAYLVKLPEPATVALLAVGGLLILRRCRR